GDRARRECAARLPGRAFHTLRGSMAAIGSRLGQQTAQRQATGLTPALQQSIKLLELSSQALAELVAEAVAENPLLEWAEEPVVARRKPVKTTHAPRKSRPLPTG